MLCYQLRPKDKAIIQDGLRFQEKIKWWNQQGQIDGIID